ncbi:unnamed protein product [Polarella glacialis]|uniref:Methyltransferase FkbM domain-containing protein n=1 Tax=Polarella glacialis TaxID=89957 RepID=A0A813EUF0_POLGL|nr:unnamed protein product [Polarella glacialis]
MLLGLPPLAELTAALVAPRSALALLLHFMQARYATQSVCPPGSRLVPARTLEGQVPFRFCVRYYRMGMDATALNDGDWESCGFLRKLYGDYVGGLPLDKTEGARHCSVVDVGSHIGLCVLGFAAQGCSVIAVDILAERVALLRQSAMINGLQHRIQIVRRALSDTSDGKLVGIYQSSGLGQLTHIEPSATSEDSQSQGSLDALLQELGTPWNSVTLLKVDPEGHDLHVLRGAEQLLEAASSWQEASDVKVRGPVGYFVCVVVGVAVVCSCLFIFNF